MNMQFLRMWENAINKFDQRVKQDANELEKASNSERIKQDAKVPVMKKAINKLDERSDDGS